MDDQLYKQINGQINGPINGPIFIPIGGACSIAYQLHKHNLRQTAYPFDWLKIKRLKTISHIIENKFDGFADFTEIDRSTKYPLIKNDMLDESSNNNCTIRAKNRYNIISCHDFSSNLLFEDQVDDIKQKYLRRISRFYDAIKSNRQVIFVRDETCKIKKDDIIEFIRCIKSINPNLDFKIRIVCRKDTCKFEVIPNQIVEIIYDFEEYGDWKRNNVEWLNIFT